MENTVVKYEFRARIGLTVDGIIEEAIAMAVRATEGTLVEFEFNGVMVTVAADSHPGLIMSEWMRALYGFTEEKVVRPHPRCCKTCSRVEEWR